MTSSSRQRKVVYAATAAMLCVAAGAAAQIRSNGPDFQLHTSIVGDQTIPHAAMQRRGRVLVTWTGQFETLPYGLGIWSQRFRSNGQPLGEENLVTEEERDDGRGEFYSSSACTDDGLCSIGWTASCDGCGDEGEIRAKIVTNSGRTVVPTFEVSTTRNVMNSGTSIARSPSGTTMIAWDNGGPPLEITPSAASARVFHRDGSPATPPFLLATGVQDARQPKVVASGDGQFLVTWWGRQEGSLTGFDIYARRFRSDGAPLGEEFRVNETTAGGQSRPEIAPSPDGGFLAVWESGGADEDLVGVYSRRFGPNNEPFAGDQHVNTFILDRQVVPKVVHDGVGGFFVAWVSTSGFSAGPGQDGDGPGVFGRHLDADGTPNGLEFQINTYTTDVQGWVLWPIGLTARAGEVFAVWQSQGQDTWGYGVFGRRFTVESGLGPVCGDAHAQDLLVDVRDAVQVLRSALDLRPCLQCLCDTDGSGDITVADARLALKAAVGVRSDAQCPACAPGEESPAGASGFGYR